MTRNSKGTIHKKTKYIFKKILTIKIAHLDILGRCLESAPLIFYLLQNTTMKNYDNITLKDINNILKKSDFYFIVQFYF